MSDDDGDGIVHRLARNAGRRYEETVEAYREGREKEPDMGDNLPRDEEGRVRIVCRRYAEKRAVSLVEDGVPACYDPDHPACQGCLEDVREDRIETW